MQVQVRVQFLVVMCLLPAQGLLPQSVQVQMMASGQEAFSGHFWVLMSP